MMSWFRKRPLLAPLLTVAVFLHSPFLAGQRTRPAPVPSSRQQAEIVFQNGIRNAQSRNDVYGQMRALEKALKDIKSLRSAQPGLSKDDDVQINRRTKQLQRMIARKTTIEVL